MSMFSSVVVGVRAPQGKAPSRGGLYLIKASCAQIAHGRSCGSKVASGDVIIMIIIILRKIFVVSMAVREESWASYFVSGALPNRGVCRGPLLIAEGVVATTVGIDIACPNPQCSSKWQFAGFALGRWFGSCSTNRCSRCPLVCEGAVAYGCLA